MKKKKGYETIDLDINDQEFIFIAKEAHKRDITFNKMIETFIADFNEKMSKLPKKEAKKLLDMLIKEDKENAHTNKK